jgi:hypothetical protein
MSPLGTKTPITDIDLPPGQHPLSRYIRPSGFGPELTSGHVRFECAIGSEAEVRRAVL